MVYCSGSPDELVADGVVALLEIFGTTTLWAVSTTPVLVCSDSLAESMSMISPVRRRRDVVFPKRDGPTKSMLRNNMSREPCVVRI